MLTLHDPNLVDRIADLGIRSLAAQRFRELSGEEPYDPDVIGPLVVVEPGDDMASIEKETGCWLVSSLFDDGVHFGDDGYVPSFEALEEHPACFEIVFIFNDNGYSTILFVPKADGIDSPLLRYCAEFAESAHQGNNLPENPHAT